MQYAATGYVAFLEAAGVRISMAAQGQPTQNAYAERLTLTLKDAEAQALVASPSPVRSAFAPRRGRL